MNTLNTSLGSSLTDTALTYSAPGFSRFGETYIETVDPNYIGPSNRANGAEVFFTRDKMKAIVNEGKFYYYDGYAAHRRKGSTAGRPTGLTSDDKGMPYFDTQLLKPIWWNGTKWVDATGADV